MAKKIKQTEEEQWVEQVIMKEEYYDLEEETKPARKIKKTKEVWPKVIQGSHSTRTEYEDGRVEFVTDWDALTRDVKQALLKYESTIPCVDTKVEKVKKTKNKKV